MSYQISSETFSFVVGGCEMISQQYVIVSNDYGDITVTLDKGEDNYDCELSSIELVELFGEY